MPQNPNLEQLLMNRPPAAPNVELPDRPDMLSEFERLLGVALGVNEQKRGSLPDLAAASSTMLPIGKLLSWFGKGKKAAKATGLQQALEKRVPFNKAELPAEFQASGGEQSMYNALRRQREGMNAPATQPPVTIVPSETKIPADPIRAAREKMNSPALKKPRDPRASGMVFGEDPNSRTDFSRILPEFRSKSGMAIDVLEEMKSKPSIVQGDSLLDDFVADAKRAPKEFTDSIGYEGPSGVNNPVASEAIFNPARRDPAGTIRMKEDPATMVGRLKSWDDTIFGLPSADKRASEEMLGRPMEPPQQIDDLIQDLSDYFAGPKYDPFRSASPIEALAERRFRPNQGRRKTDKKDPSWWTDDPIRPEELEMPGVKAADLDEDLMRDMVNEAHGEAPFKDSTISSKWDDMSFMDLRKGLDMDAFAKWRDRLGLSTKDYLAMPLEERTNLIRMFRRQQGN